MNHGGHADHGDETFFVAVPLPSLGIQRPDKDRALALIESTRKHALRAYRTVVHQANADISALFKPVTTWEGLADFFADDLVTVLAYNAAETCRYAPIGAAAVSAWRTVILSAVCYRDGDICWNTLARRAAIAEQLCEWISSGAVAAALDHS
jgi:hypothetical protein